MKYKAKPAKEIPPVKLAYHPDTGELVPEEWRDINGYVGKYQISNYGRVKSLSRKRIDRTGKIYNKQEILMRLGKADGYDNVILHKNTFPKTWRVHRLVLKAFTPNPENKPFVNHKFGIRDDNFVHHIEWCTQKENIAHAYETGLSKPLDSQKSSWAKLTWIEVGIIRDAIKAGFTQKKIAGYFQVHQSNISYIKNKTWRKEAQSAR